MNVTPADAANKRLLDRFDTVVDQTGQWLKSVAQAGSAEASSSAA